MSFDENIIISALVYIQTVCDNYETKRAIRAWESRGGSERRRKSAAGGKWQSKEQAKSSATEEDGESAQVIMLDAGKGDRSR